MISRRIFFWTFAVFSLIAAIGVTGLYVRDTNRRRISQTYEIKSVLARIVGYGLRQRGIKEVPVSIVIPAFRTILIDAGHGGKDPGAQGAGGSMEKRIVLDIAQRLKKTLESYGIRVEMTRENDEFLSLEERVEIGRRVKPDLFLSLHANSSADPSVSGMEIFFAEKEFYWAKIHQQLSDAMNDSQERLPESPEQLYQYTDPKKEARETSERIAWHLSDEVPFAMKMRSRGVKQEHFYVIAESSVPAVLVEIGFLTNPDEEKNLMDPDYREALARALTKGLMSYVREKR